MRKKIYLGLIGAFYIMPIILEAQMNDPHTTSPEATAFNNGRHIIARPVLGGNDLFSTLDEQIFEHYFGGHYWIRYTSREVSPSHAPDPWANSYFMTYARYPSIASAFNLSIPEHYYLCAVAAIGAEPDDPSHRLWLIIPDFDEVVALTYPCETPSLIAGAEDGEHPGPTYGVVASRCPPGVPRRLFFSIWRFSAETNQWTEVYTPPHVPAYYAYYPSIAHTGYGTYHIVWQRGEDGSEGIWYRQCYWHSDPQGGEWHWTPPTRIDLALPGHHTRHPFVEAYGDTVYVVWAEESNDGTYDICERRAHEGDLRRYPSSWYPTTRNGEYTVRDASVDADWPVATLGDHFIVWAENTNNWDIGYRLRLPGVPLDEIGWICYTPGVRSLYPSTVNNVAGGLIEIGGSVTYWLGFTTIWTEGNSSPYTDSSYWLLRTFNVDPLGRTSFSSLTGEPASDFPVAYYGITTGDTTPHLYCKKRDGYIQYSQYSVDYGNELIYRLPCLRRDKYYWFRALLYYEQEPLGLPPMLSQTFMFDSLMDTTVTLEAGVLDTLNLILSPECYQDYKTVMRIIGSDSTPAFLAGVILYEFNAIDTAEGYQYSSKGISLSLKNRKEISFKVHPNPFSRITTIKYRLPEGRKAGLRVYDAQGRLVKTFGRVQSLKPEVYKVIWDGTDNKGRKLPDGVYFLHLTAKKGPLVRKVMLVR